MKPFALTAWLNFCLAMRLFSQDYGVQWIQGDVPVSIMDFRNDTIQFHFLTDSPNVAMFIGTANICDKDGNFLFFTNGIYVRDRYGNLMPNGDSLCYSAQWYTAFNNLYQTVYPNGLPSHQSVMILPKPGSNHLYYIFHYITTDTSYYKLNRVNYAPLVLYYSVVDMNENFGLGAVIEKNIRLPIYQAMCSSRMTAVKHANGRDWWLIRHGDRDNKYIKFLVTPDTIAGPYFQNIGPPFNYNGDVFDFYGVSVFNQTGDKMASSCQLGPTVVLDFDRCNGEFSNPVTIWNKVPDTTLYGAMGLAFSPNGRFLYTSDKLSLRQYDLLSSNINDSIILYNVDSTDVFAIRLVQLAPNNKIYICTWHGGSYALHVINNPDEQGTNCNFQYNGQPCITGNTGNLPNMVNYKLGALTGSPCDTLTGLNEIERAEKERTIKVFPNPATDFITVVYGFTNWNKGEVTLEITNELGQIITQQQLALYSSFQTIQTSSFASGLYMAYIKRNNQIIATAKFAKQE